jgi:hypothetical protein
VKDGLVLYLDAGNPNSYNLSTPNVWRDISKRGENFILYNSPLFSTTYGGEILFSGPNDYARIRNSSSIDLISSNGTVEFWFRTISNTLGASSFARLISVADEAGTVSDTTSTVGLNRDFNNYIILSRVDGIERLGLWYKDSPNRFGSNTLVNTNSYFHAVASWSTNGSLMTFNFYLNSTNTSNNTRTQSPYSTNASTITIGQNSSGALTNPRENSSCAFSSVKFYNRALSQAEITQNFNATRGRFGI